MKNNPLHFKILFGLILSAILVHPVYAQGDPNAGVQIYRSNCAPCHGANMEGGIGSPLKGTDFVSNSDEPTLVQAVTDGREDKGMPPFKDQISEQEILDVVSLLKNPDVLAAQTPTLSIIRPDINTEDILSDIMKSLFFVFLWTTIAIMALLVWLKQRH